MAHRVTRGSKHVEMTHRQSLRVEVLGKNVTKPAYNPALKYHQRALAREELPRWVSASYNTERVLCCNLQVENRQSRALVKMLASYTDASSMLNSVRVFCLRNYSSA